jgi:hypothetical protein
VGREKHTPKILHIFADEDHVSLRDGKGAVLPLITVCEGKRTVCRGRRKLSRSPMGWGGLHGKCCFLQSHLICYYSQPL